MKPATPLLLLAAWTACASLANAQSTPTGDSVGGVASAARRAVTLRVQPGDQIGLSILREPELSDTVTVNERGEAAFAKLGVMRVDQMSISELQDTLRTQYLQYLRNPALQVVVLRRIAVNGEVRSPNVYLVDITTTLRDAIARAGGITDQGNRSKVYIVRDGQRTRVPDWDQEVGSAADLRSGDQVFVGRKSWWVLNALPVVSTTVLVASLIFTVTR